MTGEQVRELIAESNSLEHGPSRMTLAEEAVRAADQLQDDNLGYEARMAVVQAAVFGGYPEKALTAFAWIAALCDRRPEEFPESTTIGGMFLLRVDLLWSYKWVVQNTPDFTAITRAQIEETLDQMELRYKRNNVSLGPVWMNRAWCMLALGDPPEELAEIYRKWGLAARDAYADCDACEQNFRVEIHRYLGDWEKELEAAEPLLDGSLSCAEVPHITHSQLAMQLWQNGEHERARFSHERGYQMCRGNRDFLAELAEHVDYRIATRDLSGAVEIAERHLPWVAEARSDRRRWRWFVSLAELFSQLAGDRTTVALRMPRSFCASDGPYDPVALSDDFASRASELSRAFDARNGNSYISDLGSMLRERIRQPSSGL
jgi:hypothetical protein